MNDGAAHVVSVALLSLPAGAILTAFSAAKARAAKHATTRIVELVHAEDHTAQVSSTVPLHQPLFEPTPPEVWIDEYTPFQPLTIKLRFRNCDTVARRLKIEPPRSPVFHVRPWDATAIDKSGKPERLDGKVAAGMQLAFALEFSPQEVTDYAIDLVCCTERERFLVPVRVRGRFAALDLPDEIDLGLCPVRMPTNRVLTVRNVGTRGAYFAFRPSDNFRVTPASASLDQGAAVQIELSLVPPDLGAGAGELDVTDDAGQTAVVRLTGRVANVDVYLSQPLVEPSATYLSLSSRKTVKICNESEFTLEFSWKSFADAAHEELERTHLLEELAQMEAAEREQMQLQLQETEHDDLGFAQSPFDVRKALENKYRYLRKATLEDSMQFVDSCFSVAPLSGRVWAHSEVDVVVCFTPEVAHLYSCYAFLEIAGQAARLPLQIRGQGIGPKVKVVYNELLDFGDVFINDERTRDFTIQNKGEIPAEFELIPLVMSPGTTLNVHPNCGTLEVNAMLKIEVTFCSQELGEAFQHVCFSLKGSDEQLTVRFKAHVIPPVFHFDADQVDFGAVSYSFPQTRTVKLINASKIAMKYSLRVPEEASYKQKELELVPSDGKLDAYGEQQIAIHFTSHHVKVYQYQLVVGVTGVGTDLLSIPVRAQCFVPELAVLRPELDFGCCFLRYPHKQTLVLENKSSHLFGRFEIGEQDDHSRAIATYSASDFCGTVRPGERVSVEISLACEKLGSIRLPMVVSVPGSTDLPLSVALSATGSGPKVELDQPEIHWGSCSCLVDHERILRMTNVSLIPAAYKTFIRNARSKFQVDKKEGVLAAGESLEFVLVANLDDTVVFKDQLHILITEGDNLVVPLAIKGTGTTMWSPSELRVIDFNHQMTSKECEWSCTLENKGKRVQVLTWLNKSAVAANSKFKSDGQGAPSLSAKKGVKGRTENRVVTKSGGNNRDGGGNAVDGRDEVIPVFSVFPGTIELKPRTACVFVFKGLSSSAGLIQEELVCETRVGKEKSNKVAFVTAIRGNFVDPKLTPSSSLLSFEYVHHPGNQITTQSQPLSLTNACELPLSFTLRTQTPFSLDCWEAVLQPGEKVDLNVEFYPGFKDDHTCRVINGKVLVAFTGHPQKDSVDLLGDISFPNLTFGSTKIDFGCTLNDTQKSVSLNVTNVSKVDTAFRWIFIEDEKETQATATAKKPYIPINQVFDIAPIRGLLKPNESEEIEFVYYGHANRKFKSTVACEVEGGPEYELTLLGEASSLAYKLDKHSLDFGQVLYNKIEDRDFSILNVGKVPFSFNIIAENIARGRTVEVAPTSGKIAPNEKQRILVRLRPGIPEPFEETMVLEIAHFQPIPFKLYGCGTFAAVSINLPREGHPSSTTGGEAPKWKDLKKQARQNIELGILNAAKVDAHSNQGISNHTSALTPSDSKSTISTALRGIERTSSVSSMPTSPHAKMAVQRPGGPSKESRGAPIDDLDIEIEACRLFFAEFLLIQEHKKADARALKPTESGSVNEPAGTTEALRVEEVAPKDAAPPGVAANAKVLKKRGLEAFSFILSQFVLDFGNVVVGTHKIKRFSITNIGHGPASFQLDKNLANSRGFQIEPERVVRLPEKQAVEFAVTFQARKNIAMGLHMVQLPVVIKNGPPCVALIRAHVTVPDISISTESLDFGKIAVSTCHTMFTQLQNVSAIPAEWAFKKPMGSAKDVGNFRFTPQSGVLAPGNRVNIQIEFMPDDGRHFMLKLPIAIASNPKTRSIVCRGEGSELRVSFHPPIVELGPVLPCAPVEEQLVEIRNDSDYTVEVFSLDFDMDYQQDEDLLRSLNVFNTEGVLQLPVRIPGQSTREYLAGNDLIPIESSETVSESVQLKERNNATDQSSEVCDPLEEELMDTSKRTALEVQDAEAIPSSVWPRRGIDYIVLGPPRCGKSTQAQLLAQKENLAIWTIDDAIEAVCTATNPLAAATRRALGIDRDEDRVTFHTEGGQEFSVVGSAQETPEVDDIPDAFPALSTSPGAISVKLAPLLDQIIMWRMSQPDLESGGVLDGFDNSFVPFEVTIKSCAKVFVTARVILLTFDEDSYEAMSVILVGEETKDPGIAPISSHSTDRIFKVESSSSGEHLLGIENGLHAERGDLEHAQRIQSRDGKADAVEPQHSVLEAEISGEGKHTVSSSPSRERLTQAAPDAVISQGTQPDNHADLRAELSVIRDRLVVLAQSASAEAFKLKTFAEYAQELERIKRQLTLFLARDSVEPDLSSQMPATSSDVPESSNDAVEAQAKDRTNSDNFLLDIPISEPGPPLLLHGMIYSAIEKFVRELEASHLPLPGAAKYQLIRRPPERFSRKPTNNFTLRCPSLTESSSYGASSERGLHMSSSLSQTTSAETDEGEVPSNDSAVNQDNSAVTATRPRSSKLKKTRYRWVIDPHSSVNVLVQFASTNVGNFDCSLGFEIVGVRREFTLFGRGTCSVPTINNDPRNVFMHRVKSRPDGVFVQKKFVIARNQFEFGPLIIGNENVKPPDTEREFAEWQKTNPNNIEIFRMSNSSKFPIRLDLAMEKLGDSTFTIFPPSLQIKEGDTAEVKLWANPSKDGLHENALICCISDNPEPVAFPISCYGCTPDLRLRGPWEQPAAASTSELEDQRQSADRTEPEEDRQSNAPMSARSSVPGSEAPLSSRSIAQAGDAAHSVRTSQQPLLDFEQLLLKRQDEKTFFIENVSPIAVSWRLIGGDLPSDFRVFPMEGIIKSLQKVPILVTFSATVEAVHKHPLQIEFSDTESALQVSERNRTLDLLLCGEAYKIEVSTFESSDHEASGTANQTAAGIHGSARDGNLDFGLVRVGEKHSRSFNIGNKGKYRIKHLVSIRTAASREYFTVDPSEMILEPGQSSAVKVTFMSTHEVTLRDCKDIKCTIIEMLSAEVCREFHVLTTARSVFSKFRLQPNCGINFGPHKYKEKAQARRIDVRNDGEFPFKFRIRASSAEVEGLLTIDTPLSPSALSLGQFVISPDCGTVDPGGMTGLEVSFLPKDCGVYSEMLRIEISGHNPEDEAEKSMLLYELVGESCYPGISTTDFDGIFEEQIVVRSLGADSATPSSAGAFASIGVQNAIFAEKEKIFSFGPMIAATNWKGTVERFKISNPMKVSSTVFFAITSNPNSNKSAALGSAAESEGESQTFTVQPTVWEIPPLEHRFVSVYFRPTTIALFNATFTAKVDDSPPQSNSSDTLLEFELRGEGTMPCITVTEPIQRDATGALVVDFGRIQVSKGKDTRLTLRNDGILPATVLFFLQPNLNFLFALGNGSVVVPPKATETLTVQFRPQKIHEEPTVSQLKITVQNNAFDETTVKLSGVGYREDLIFEDLPFGHDDELHFDDIRLRSSVESPGLNGEVGEVVLSSSSTGPVPAIKDAKVFSLCNQSSSIVRFEWQAALPFRFSPAIGHLKPRSHKLITATFEPGSDGAKAVVFKSHRVTVQAQRISYKGSSPTQSQESDWDETAQTVSFEGHARSDYAQWRAPNLVGPHRELGPLDPSVKVIEMESLGIRVRNTRRFYVVNPTNVSYEFSWTPQGEVNPCFRCATPKGLMLAGKRCEMIFEFTPQQLELQEMFWHFKIPHFQVSQLFLFVGTTTEPRVILDRGSVNFNTLLIGTKTSQSIALVNQEHIPFNFVFDKASLDFAGEVPALLVHPLSGVVPPNGRTTIEIEFIPTEEKAYSFNLNCIVKRKPTRLSLNVKGEGYSIHDALTLVSDESESRAMVLGPGNLLDFGSVRVNEEAQRSIVIYNSGKFNFEFN
ncbi:hypothetical protein BBJ28_00008070 [Nothophytophthora sp. Chile5]|nr:hypothetical protein BBJ28_00008070 [Nothophytophthora sp. Chile5]